MPRDLESQSSASMLHPSQCPGQRMSVCDADANAGGCAFRPGVRSSLQSASGANEEPFYQASTCLCKAVRWRMTSEQVAGRPLHCSMLVRAKVCAYRNLITKAGYKANGDFPAFTSPSPESPSWVHRHHPVHRRAPLLTSSCSVTSCPFVSEVGD